MGFNRFSSNLMLRLSALLLALAALLYLLGAPEYKALTLLILIVVVILIFDLFRYVSKTNTEVSRFLDAVRYSDFGQRFEFPDQGAGFKELGDTFTQLLERFREDRQHNEAELRHLKALLEHVPVPLISVHSNDKITLWNNSARRLFGVKQISRASDLDSFGQEFRQQVQSVLPGEQILVPFRNDDLEQRLTISASEISFAGGSERLISLQNIQSELDGMQLNAWQDLVRVLTHEIMNSITPVASLAKTAVDLVDDVSGKISDETKLAEELIDELQDVKNAVNTVSRRSDGLMNFVSSYRQLTRLPEPEKTRFKLTDLFSDAIRMATVDWQQEIITSDVEPVGLDIFADREMLEQVLINLLQNSKHALLDTPGGKVQLTAKLNSRGKVSITITDNGPGIADELVSRIFVPFYTTRKNGSGVGLALSRQVMLAHGGNISFSHQAGGGACFTLAF